MTPQDVVSLLDSSSEHVTALTGKITVEQGGMSLPGKWSVIEILEHIYLTEKLVHFIVSRPSAATSDAPEKIGNEKLERLLVGQRNRAVKAPDMLQPKGAITSITDFTEKFNVLRGLIKNDLISGRIVIDNRVHKHPVIGEMTIRDWLFFIPHHTQRHLQQINETLAASDL